MPTPEKMRSREEDILREIAYERYRENAFGVPEGGDWVLDPEMLAAFLARHLPREECICRGEGPHSHTY